MKFKTILLMIFTLLIFNSCKKKTNSILSEKEVIILNSKYNKWLFDESGYEKWLPKNSDIKTVHDVIEKAIQNNEFSFLKKPIKENIQKIYYRQYIPYINKKGERMIEVNAFCDFKETPLPEHKDIKIFNWKRDYHKVFDGGMCFWRVTINMDKKTYDKVNINGV